MTLIVVLVCVYAGLYVVLSLPAIQNRIKERVCAETSEFLGGRIGIRNLSVRPFSEVILSDVTLDSPEGDRCCSIGKVAAGIDLWALVSDRKIVLNYAELIGLDVNISQPIENGPLNIQFLIEALSPKDKDKPSAEFDVRIRNVVVRDSRAYFRREWLASKPGLQGRLSEIGLRRLRMDLSIPTLRNDLFRFDIRNLQFEATPGVNVRSLSADISYSKDTTAAGKDRLAVKGLNISLPKSSLTVSDIELILSGTPDIDAGVHGSLSPADFASLAPELGRFDSPLEIGIVGSLKGKQAKLSEFRISDSSTKSYIDLQGSIDDLSVKDSLDIDLDILKIDLAQGLVSEVLATFTDLKDNVRKMIESAGRVRLDIEGTIRKGVRAESKGQIITEAGRMDFEAKGSDLQSKRPHIGLTAEIEGLELDRLLLTDKAGRVSASIDADITGFDRHAEGRVSVNSDDCTIMGNLLHEVTLNAAKTKDNIELSLSAASRETNVKVEGSALLAGSDTRVETDMSITRFNPAAFGIKGKLADSDITGHLKASLCGNNADNLTGRVALYDLKMTGRGGKALSLPKLSISVDTLDAMPNGIGTDLSHGPLRDMNIDCDWLTARISGKIRPSTLGKEIKEMASSVMPSLINDRRVSFIDKQGENDFTFDLTIKGETEPYAFFETPVRPLSDIPVRGSFESSRGKATLETSTPHLQQGKNKLIRDIHFKFDMDAFTGMAKVNAGLIFPAKKGDAELETDIYAIRDKVNVNIGINPRMTSVVKGNTGLTATFTRLPDSLDPNGTLAVGVDIVPSAITVNDKIWTISDGNIDYTRNRISISDFLINHDGQYVRIDGTASERAEDKVSVRLNDIDLEYIFNILNINYVTFGGMATGEVVGNRLLTKDPKARTEFLRVRGLSYNGAVLGDGDLASEYDASEQKVGIYAVIRDPLTKERRANIDGGIWVTRDSLSFGFDARKVNVGVMKPFVSAFCSDLYGAASGKCKLYGTFSDIDLVGALKADTLSMKLDFTNTWYHAGGDSVFLHTGVIEIPPLILYDDEKHSAEFSGWLRHRYFHDPVFNFRLKDAKSILCYDTNEKINPLWYGTIYGSGHAQINGYPGLIEIDMNMTTEENSRFYYVISDAEDVAQYSFLTFTDRRKEIKQAEAIDSIPDYLKRFHKQTGDLEGESSNVILSLKGTVTNDALVTIVMDPKAGDNITARGQGALQMDYNLASNDLRMIGTYVLDEGNYNFTLQDIIIKNFSIRKGSMIKFDGDPMKANLDIAATYRVNTNLTDLDKSFSTDKELNRTNVPVDAVLLVDGPMTNPDITFDIELPSLTSDVERKVKSIVSTNDMMSRQIIYLLALNRFYTPEYTGGQSSSGREWSSMASSTISSQLSNILSQMTDKLDVAPSFRSDKGDFSDMEFDLALSSRLLNNRLLINGNFGYRDKNTSNTQFVGDFDIEYLLSKNGNLRLKAYNHFNDQNYYLRSALTTQGVGVVFRRDFDRLFGRRKREDESERSDSVATHAVDAEGNVKETEATM